jgi:hypothetical protein
LHEICNLGGWRHFNEDIDPSPIIRLLVGAGSNELLIEDYDPLYNYHGPTEAFSYLLQQCYPPVNQWSPQDRRPLAWSIGDAWWPNTFALMQMALKPAKLEEIVQARRPDETSLLHLCQNKYKSAERPFQEGREKTEVHLSRLEYPNFHWREFTRELIMAGENVTAPDVSGISPLGMLMTDNLLGFPEMCKVLRTWLADLNHSGVDLEEYGRRELALSRLPNTYPPWTEKHGSVMRFSSYGPAVEDWHFLALEPTDQFAGIFWELVEKQTQLVRGSEPELDLSEIDIPGSWPAFDDENDQ